MAIDVTMPVLGLTMEEGTVAEWLKREGDAVQRDEPLLLVEMDKGTVEVPSPGEGVLQRIVVQPGTTVPVRTVIAQIGAPGEAPAAMPSAAPAERRGVLAASPIASPAGAPGAPGAATSAGAARPLDAAVTVGAGVAAKVNGGPRRLFASPRARMRARERGVDLAALRGTGPNGRIVEADVLDVGSVAADASPRVAATPMARRLASERGVSLDDVVGSGPGGRVTHDDVLRVAAAGEAPGAHPSEPGATRHEAARARLDGGEVQPMSRLRKLTAERMAASAQSTARVTLFLEADFSEASRFRQQLQPEFARLGVEKLPWDALLAKAAGLALVEHSALLHEWVDAATLRGHSAVDVGVAVALEPEGLVVPVLRDAAHRSLRELAGDLLLLADKARAGRLGPDEMAGGTFTITNLGAYRVDGFTPIINPPQTAILGVGRIADKAAVVDGRLEARTMCTLSLSFDHRVVDGAPAAAFLARLAELVERPYALLGI